MASSWARRTAPLEPCEPGESMISAPQDLEELTPLGRHVFGQHDLECVSALLADHGQRDARVARGGLEDGGARLKRAVGLGIVDHRLGDAVLHRAGGVLRLELGQDPDVRVGAELADVDDRGVADQVEHGGMYGHNTFSIAGSRSNVDLTDRYYWNYRSLRDSARPSRVSRVRRLRPAGWAPRRSVRQRSDSCAAPVWRP